MAAWGLAAFLAASLPAPGAAGHWSVSPPGENLQATIDAAADGDEIVLQPGTYRGPLVIGHRITLTGQPGAALVGSGKGSTITVRAPAAVVRGLVISGSGRSLETMDAAVFLEQSATGARVEDNRIEDNLFGVYVHGAADAIVSRNVINGLRQGRVAEAGNGVSVWNATGAKVLDNDIRFGRDGVLVNTSHRNSLIGNRFRDLRFAVHYMYGNDGEISRNVSIGNTIGYALMFSQHLTVQRNLSRRDRDYGLLFNYANGSLITDNVVEGGPVSASRAARDDSGREHGVPPGDETRSQDARIGPEKCVFVYNANTNKLAGNWFENCEIGIHFTAGSERNEIVGNAFVSSRTQVKYVGTRVLDWSSNGRGNYWSDNTGFDLDGDGIADTAYRPNDLVDTVLWTTPLAKVLLNSPAVQLIRWAQGQFPALLPGGVLDSHPLMAPPPKPAISSGGSS
jgi:nitrous oxidase accessory protein